jgi:hypothetical protein
MWSVRERVTTRSRTRHVHHVLVDYTFSYTSRPSCTCRLHVLVHVTSIMYLKVTSSRTRHVHLFYVAVFFTISQIRLLPDFTTWVRRRHLNRNGNSLQFASTRVNSGFWLLSRDSFIKEHTPFESLKIWGLIIRNFLLQFLHQARKESNSALGVSIYVFDSVLDFETFMSVVYFFFHFKIIEKKHVIVAN